MANRIVRTCALFFSNTTKEFLFREKELELGRLEIIIATMGGGEMMTEGTHTFNNKDPGPTLLS